MAYKNKEDGKAYDRRHYKEYYKINRDKIIKRNKQYYENHKEERKEYNIKYYENYKEELKVKRKEYRKKTRVKKMIKEMNKEYYEKHNEKVLEQKKKYREINKEELNEKGKQYYTKNKKIISKKNKIYKKIHEEELKEKRKQYRNTLRGKLTHRRGTSKRRERKLNVISLWTKEEWKKVLHNSNGFCYGYKRKPHYVGIERLNLDHVYPLSKAEKNRIYTINDIQPLCPDCNSTKGSKQRLQK